MSGVMIFRSKKSWFRQQYMTSSQAPLLADTFLPQNYLPCFLCHTQESVKVEWPLNLISLSPVWGDLHKGNKLIVINLSAVVLPPLQREWTDSVLPLRCWLRFNTIEYYSFTEFGQQPFPLRQQNENMSHLLRKIFHGNSNIGKYIFPRLSALGVS